MRTPRVRRVHHYPHQVVRYSPVLRALRALPPDARVLEIGPGAEGLGAWIGRSFVGADIDPPETHTGFMRPVTADACAMPFADASFDLVCAVDMLSDVTGPVLDRACAEMARIARGSVIIVCVSGSDATRSDERMLAWCSAKGSRPQDWLTVQTETGVPEPSRIVAALSAHGAVHVETNTSVIWHERLFRIEHAMRRLRAMTVLQPLLRRFGPRLARPLGAGDVAYRSTFTMTRA